MSRRRSRLAWRWRPARRTAIVARAMGVPAVGGSNGLRHLAEDGDATIADGEGGLAWLSGLHNPEIVANFQARIAAVGTDEAEDLPCLRAICRPSRRTALKSTC
ncbi:MAG: PEP-utilizing enzyme [Hyphomonadaceae bacterium]